MSLAESVVILFCTRPRRDLWVRPVSCSVSSSCNPDPRKKMSRALTISLAAAGKSSVYTGALKNISPSENENTREKDEKSDGRRDGIILAHLKALQLSFQFQAA